MVVKEVMHKESKDTLAQSFISEYSDLIISLTKLFNSKFWFATWLSSKNRFDYKYYCDVEYIYLNGKFPNYNKINVSKVIIRLIHLFFKSLHIIAKIYFAKTLLINNKKRFGKPKEVYVLKTFAYEKSFQENKFIDLFFPPLRKHLQNKGIEVLTIYDPIGSYRKIINKTIKVDKGILPIFSYLTAVDVCKVWSEVILGLFEIRKLKEIKFHGYEVVEFVMNQLKKDLSGYDCFFSLLFFYAFKRIGQEYNVINYTLSCENNSWERLSIMGLRSSNKKCKIIGYQHTVVPQAAMNMFPHAEEFKYYPHVDQLNTVGLETLNIINNYGKLSNQSFLEPSCAMRFEYLFDLNLKTNKPQKHLLVALEGVPEADHLLKYILDNAQEIIDSGWTITVRTHPVFPMEEFEKKISINNKLKSQIKFTSTVPIKNDLDEAGVVIYWGSTVALEAVMMGIPVIHFDYERILSYDPLFRFSQLKWVINERTSLKNVLQEIVTIDLDQLKKRREEGRKYILNYFWPINSDSLDKFI